ncbi:hypothetical protein MVEN_02375600 [Mycena venus]|uniref:Uncharacterized protein n=1 Tax=Mycena venus TaxID=2733690 RepID=A0A8H7CF17_9AGAR|nr:hypothetical protein MVEN_02375600 [Mycena venus]
MSTVAVRRGLVLEARDRELARQRSEISSTPFDTVAVHSDNMVVDEFGTSRWQVPKSAPASSTPSARSGKMMHRCVPSFHRLPLRYADHPPALHEGSATGLSRSRHRPRETPQDRPLHALWHLPPPFLFPVRMPMISLHVNLATNCYGYHVVHKLLRGDPATTLVDKHASHV